MSVVVLVQLGAYFDAELRRKLVDQLAHLSISDERDFHAANTATSGSRKNSACSLSTAPFKSSCATTTLRFNNDAPWEIIRMLMSRSASNVRLATPGVNRMLSPTRQTIAWS